MSYDGGYEAGYDAGWLGGEEEEEAVAVVTRSGGGGIPLFATGPMRVVEKPGLALPGTIVGRFALMPVEASGGGEATVSRMRRSTSLRREVSYAVTDRDVARLAGTVLEAMRGFIVSGHARVEPQIVGFRKTELMDAEAHGIQNPTDEELAILAMLMFD